MSSVVGKMRFVSKMNSSITSKYILDNLRLHGVRYQSILSRKLIYSEYGEAAKVVVQETEHLPLPSDSQVIVEMLAASVNPADINTIQGAYPIKPPLPSIPGNEGVGRIEHVGPNVTTLKKGDHVIPKHVAWGTWRTHALCNEKELIKISKEISIVQAATLTVNPCTAYRMLKDFVQLKPGDTVLQNGANGAAGQNVIQICHAWGYKSVNIVRKRENIEELKAFLTNLGATYVLTDEELRKTDIFKKKVLPKPMLVLNAVGGPIGLECIRQLDQKGVMVTYGGMSREPVTIPTSALIFKDVVSKGFWMTRWSTQNVDTPQQKQMFEDISTLIKEGKLKPPAHTLVPFSSFKDALSNTLSMKGFAQPKCILNFQET